MTTSSRTRCKTLRRNGRKKITRNRTRHRTRHRNYTRKKKNNYKRKKTINRKKKYKRTIRGGRPLSGDGKGERQTRATSQQYIGAQLM